MTKTRRDSTKRNKSREATSSRVERNRASRSHDRVDRERKSYRRGNEDSRISKREQERYCRSRYERSSRRSDRRMSDRHEASPLRDSLMKKEDSHKNMSSGTRSYILYPPVSRRHLGFQLSPKSHAIKAAEIEYQQSSGRYHGASEREGPKTESYKPASSKLQYLPR